MGQHYGAKIVTAGLVVHFDAANPKCYSGTGLNFFNLANNPDITTAQLYGDTSNYGGVVDGTIELGGADGNNSSGTFLRGYGDIASTVNFNFTSSAWMYNTNSTSSEILSYRESSRRLSTYVTTSGIYFTQRRSVDPFDTQSTGVSVSNPLNEWAHFTVVKQANNWSFYKNGILVGTTTFALIENVANSTAFASGIAWRDDDYLSNVMDGRLGPIMHYTRSLSEEEVYQNFEAARGRFGL
jgi:hypothetical protein